jgi:hypothetical protein
MSVKATASTENLTLVIDNGDRENLTKVLSAWNFKDEESFLRFVSSIMLDTQEKAIYIQRNSAPMRVSPAPNLLATGKEGE